MSHAFKVSWLSKKCLKFYRTNILNFERNTYDEIVFACEVASRAHTHLKQTKYVDYFIKTAASWKIGKSIFMQRYMADFSHLSKRQLNMAIAIAENDHRILATCLVSHLSITLLTHKDQEFDENSLYLLENIDLKRFSREFPCNFLEFSRFLTEISEISSFKGIQPILEKLVAVNENEVGKTASNLSYSQTSLCNNSCDSEAEELSDDESNSCAFQTDSETSKGSCNNLYTFLCFNSHCAYI